MFNKFEIITAWRYVRTKKGDGFISLVSWFALLGITLGVAALILVMAVMGGFRQELLGRVLGITGHLTLTNTASGIENYKVIERKLKSFPEITSATGFIRKQALFTHDDNSRGIIVRGVEPKALRGRAIFKNSIFKTDLSNFENGKGILIGSGIAKIYGISRGDTFTLMVPQRSVFGGTSSIPKIVKYKVAGLFDIGMYRYDNGMVFMPLKKAQQLFGIKGVTQVEATLKDADYANSFVDKNGKKIGTDNIEAWARVNSSFFNALEVERNTMFIILSVMILIAVFNVVTGQIMIVKDRKKSIAIMRTLGVSRGSVVKIFFIVGSFLGIVGTATGVGLGVLLATNLEAIRTFLRGNFGIDIFNPEVYHLKTIPVIFNTNDIVTIGLYSIIISLLAALYPAIRAGRMHPVEGLRND